MTLTQVPSPPADPATGGAITPTATTSAPAPTTGRRLIDAKQCAAKARCSVRHWIRLCDYGIAPPGVKLFKMRRWDEAVIDAWIAAGCKPVGEEGGHARA